MSFLKFDPAVGAPFNGGDQTAEEYRRRNPMTVWVYNPWTGEKRLQCHVDQDPYGEQIQAVKSPLYAVLDKAIPQLAAALVGGAPNTISTTLSERGKRYGKFTGHAQITQDLKATMHGCPKWAALAPDQKEALEMVVHKIGRILNGDPDYDDSWVDIAGYAKLVADRLQGVER